MLEQTLVNAFKWHLGQYRKNTKVQVPYIVHPVEVMKKLINWGVNDEKILQAALLHDVLEDTECKVEDLSDYDELVIRWVKDMTQEEELSKEDYIERFTNCDVESFVIKMSDRLCNIMDFAVEHKYPKYFKSLERFCKILKNREFEISNRFGMKVLARIFDDVIATRDYIENKYNFALDLEGV